MKFTVIKLFMRRIKITSYLSYNKGIYRVIKVFLEKNFFLPPHNLINRISLKIFCKKL